MTLVWAYRASLSPFSSIDADAIIKAPVSCFDSLAGFDSWSMQLNALGARYLIQNVIEVRDAKALTWTLYAADRANSVKMFAPLAIPPIDLGSPDDALEVHIGNDANGNLVFAAGAVTDSMPRPWQSLEVPTSLKDSLYAASINILGMGSGSRSNFTAGAFDCSISCNGIDDIAAWISPPQNPPDSRPWIDQGTNEESNLNPSIGLLRNDTLRLTLSTLIST